MALASITGTTMIGRYAFCAQHLTVGMVLTWHATIAQPLHYAVSRSTGISKLLLARQASVDALTLSGETPLFAAVRTEQNTDTVRMLLDHGADVNAANARKETPLLAVRYANTQPERERQRQSANTGGVQALARRRSRQDAHSQRRSRQCTG